VVDVLVIDLYVDEQLNGARDSVGTIRQWRPSYDVRDDDRLVADLIGSLRHDLTALGCPRQRAIRRVVDCGPTFVRKIDDPVGRREEVLEPVTYQVTTAPGNGRPNAVRVKSTETQGSAAR
jgi:hypothetical protein